MKQEGRPCNFLYMVELSLLSNTNPSDLGAGVLLEFILSISSFSLIICSETFSCIILCIEAFFSCDYIITFL